MATQTPSGVSRRRLLCWGVASAAALASPAVAAPSIVRGAGDVRVINLSNAHTHERLNAVYWVEGTYIPEVLDEVDHIMRDWRAGLKMRIAPDLVDIIAATHRLLETDEPFSLYSGYRSPATNAWLRRRSRGVARQSYHVKGMAADLHMDGRSVRQISRAARKLKAGGIGRYSRSAFVHLDSGPVREWGR